MGTMQILVGHAPSGVRAHSIIASDSTPRRTLSSSLAQALACWLLTVSPLFAANHPAVTGRNANCVLCHADMTRGTSVHSQGELSCGMCHTSEPHGNKVEMLLTVPKEQICFACHERAAIKQSVSPDSNKDCLDCHDAHRSARVMLLRRNVEEDYGHSSSVPTKSNRPHTNSKLKSTPHQATSATSTDNRPRNVISITSSGDPYHRSLKANR